MVKSLYYTIFGLNHDEKNDVLTDFEKARKVLSGINTYACIDVGDRWLFAYKVNRYSIFVDDAVGNTTRLSNKDTIKSAHIVRSQ